MNSQVTDREIIAHLNIILRNELTAINQYFLHARMLKSMGFMKLADHEYKTSIDEMKHADMLVERILALKSAPSMHELGKIFIGETVEDILQCDLKREEQAGADLRAAIGLVEAKGDSASAAILRSILKNEEEHVLFIRTQLNLIESTGESPNFPLQPKPEHV